MPKRTSHSNRYAQLPEAFRKYLQRYLPGYRKESPRVQLAVLTMILQANSRFRAHGTYDGWARFHYLELERKFGRGGFARINRRLNLFHIQQDEDGRDEWSLKNGVTKAYMLTEKVSDLRAKFLNGVTRRKTNLLTEDGDVLRSLPKQAVEAKRRQKNGLLVTRAGWHGKPVETAVPVDQKRLRALILEMEARQYQIEKGFPQAGLFHADPDPHYLSELREEARVIYQLAANTVAPGKVIHRYGQSESGRLYARDVNLQNAYRPVRQAALHGCYDYDIENCHYSILEQMAARHGYQCGAIRNYLGNKKQVRQELAAKHGIKPKQVKLALIALVYGATFSERPKDALPKILGSVEAALAFYEDPVFQALGGDIKAARSAILKGQQVFRGRIKNMRGLTMEVKGHADRQLLAHLLQGVESVALEAAHQLYPEKIVLLQHDGFTATDNSLDIAAIERAIFDATGYNLEVEQDGQIMVMLDDALDDHPVSIPNQNPEKPNGDKGLQVSIVS